MIHNQIKKALRGVKVEVTHRGNMRRKYRISGLTSQATQELTYARSFAYRLILEYIFSLTPSHLETLRSKCLV